MPIIVTQPGPLGVIAKGIEDRLRLVFPENRFTLEYISDKPKREEWQRVLRTLPAIVIYWHGLQPGSSSATQLSGDTNWLIYVAVQNQRSMRARYFGDSLAPGLFQLVSTAASMLHGLKIPDAGSVQVHAIETASPVDYDPENLAMAGIGLTIRTSLPLNACLGGVEVDSLAGQTIEWSFGGDAVAFTDNVETS